MTDLNWCSGCQANLPTERFARNRTKPTGYANWCKDCMRKIYTRPEYLVRRKQRRDEDWSHALAIECRSRARAKGLPYNIEASDLQVPLLCPILGVPLYRTRGKKTANSPSVDRIIPALGYVKGNVAVISWEANRIKGACDDPEVFERMAQYLRTRRRPKIVA